MIAILPRLRLAGMGLLPLLLGGCMSGVLPGTEATDPSCMLLCALARELTGDPTPQPQSALPISAKPLADRHAAATAHHPPKPPVVASARSRPGVRAAHLRPTRPVPHTEGSVVPRAPAREPAPKAAAMVPTGPAPVAIAPPPLPTTPMRNLSQSIPGSANIMPQGWRGP